MTQPPTRPPHLHAMDHSSETWISIRRSAIQHLTRQDGGYDYDTGQPTQFWVIASSPQNIVNLRVATFNNAQDRDNYIRDDPDGLLAP